MKLFLAFSILFFTACAHVESKSSFITISYMDCIPIKKLYYKDQLAQIESFWLDSQECGIGYRNIRIRKDLIVGFGQRFSIILDRINKNDDNPRAALKVSNIEVEHCLIQLQSGKMRDISMTCEELEKELK